MANKIRVYLVPRDRGGVLGATVELEGQAFFVDDGHLKITDQGREVGAIFARGEWIRAEKIKE